MKKLVLLIIAALTVSACARTLYSEEQIITDFRPYTNIGFFLSPTAIIDKEYTPIAVIEIKFRSGNRAKIHTAKVAIKEESKSNLFSFKRDPEQIVEWEWVTPNYDDMLTSLVGYAVDLGANGIINLTITENRDIKGNLISKTARGFAVKVSK